MSRINYPIWQDTTINETGVTLQHLVNGSWVNTGMKVMPMPDGYTPEAAINRYAEKDLKSTVPNLNYSGTTGVTPQPYAYQVYRLEGADAEVGFINDWSYEEWSGEQRCLSAPINRHADTRQKLVYGNFAETGNSIIVKELVKPIIIINPREITINADGRYAAVTITSNKEYTLSAEGSWFTLSVDSGEPGTQVIYISADENTTFYDREAVITMTYESYWDLGYDTITAFTITQKAVSPTFVVTPMEQSVAWDYSGLTYFFVNTNVPFTVSTESSWLTYSGMSQAGHHTYNVYFNTNANTGDSRQAAVSFTFQVDATGGTYTVTPIVRQNSAPNITIEPQSREIAASAQSIRIRVTSEANWTASTSESWISAPTSGESGVSLIFIDVEPYSSITDNRTGYVVFSNGAKQATFSILQMAPYHIKYNSLKEIKFNASSGQTYFNANITAQLWDSTNKVGYILFDTSPTKIGNSAFSGKTLTAIEMPDTITTIGTSAFKNCTGLTTTTIPSGLTSIGESAYEGTKLPSYLMPDTVISLGSACFSGCTYLNNLHISTGLTSIPIQAFAKCTSLQSVEIPSIVRTIGTLTMPIGTQTTSKYYELGAFNGCTNLSAVTLSEGLQSLGHGTFYNCNITEISLPKTCERAGLGAFGYSAITINTYYDADKIYGGWYGDGKTNGTYFYNHSDNSGYTITVPDAMIHMDGFTYYDTPNLIPGLIWREKPSVPDGAVRYLSGKDLNFNRGLSGNTVGTKYIPFGDVYASPGSGTTNAYYTQNTKGLFQFNIDYYPNFRTTMPNGVVAVYHNRSNQWDNGMQYLSAIAFADSFTTINADLRNNYQSSNYFYTPLRQIYFGTGMTICNLSASTTELYELDFRNTQVRTITGVWQIGASSRHRNINIRLPRTLTTLKPYLREMYYPAFYYEGTMAEWRNVNFSPVSVLSGTTYIIHCSDGDVTVTF